MRPICLLIAALVALLVSSAALAGPDGCDAVHRPGGPMPSRAAALELLGSLTQLDSPLGRPVLASNFSMTVAINNDAPPLVRAQALKDAQVTAANAATLADGLGPRMDAAYRRRATFEAGPNGEPINVGATGPAVSALIRAGMGVSGRDSAEAKCAFANGIEPFQGGHFSLPPDGVFDVLGKAYHLRAGPGRRNPYGNPRPYLTAPLDVSSGPHIESFDAIDFFGVPMNSRVVLAGATSADRAAGRFADSLDDSPAFPSGHTTFAYTEALLLAMMVPERYRALAYRASEYGNSRIVLGAHYVVDVIGGRTLATYDLAQDLAGTAGYAKVDGKSFRAALTSATRELRDYFQQEGCVDIAACAAAPIIRAADAGVETPHGFAPSSPADAYSFRLAYALAPLGPTDQPPEPVPSEAAALLETRFPYLNTDQRREILRTTEGPSGHFLDVDPLDGRPIAAATGPRGAAGVYSRLNLFAAAGGYARFDSDVTVNQDPAVVSTPDLTPFVGFARDDTWANDISGAGGLTKRGAGRLVLAGHSTYADVTRVEGGTLVVDGSVRSAIRVEASGTLAGGGATGDVAVAGGVLAPGSATGQGTLTIGGGLSMDKGSKLSIREVSAEPNIQVAGKVRLDGAILVLKKSATLRPGASFTLLTAPAGVSGTFAHVRTDTGDLVANVTYGRDAISITLDAVDSR